MIARVFICGKKRKCFALRNDWKSKVLTKGKSFAIYDFYHNNITGKF